MKEEDRIESIKAIGGIHLKNFKRENITSEMCSVAVLSDGAALQYVPEQLRTPELYFEACKRCGTMLELVPVELRTETICNLAVESDGLALAFVPKGLRTKEICLKAILNNQHAYSYTPIDIVTPEFVVSVIKSGNYESLGSLPNAVKNASFFLELVKHAPRSLWYIPSRFLSAKVCMAAVRASGFSCPAEAVKETPDLLCKLNKSLYDHDTCLNFVKSDYFKNSHHTSKGGSQSAGFNTDEDRKNGKLYLYQKYYNTYSLPDLMRWPDVCMPILEKNGYYLRYAKPEIITEQMCLTAIESNPYSLELIPEKYKTKELCLHAIEIEPFTIEYVPVEFISDDIALDAVKVSGFILKDIPEQLRTREICQVALLDKGRGGIENIPKSLLDKDMVMTWLNNAESEYDPLEKIPSEVLDYDVCYAALKFDGTDIRKVPGELINEKMCIRAVKQSPFAAKYIPRNMFTYNVAEALLEKSCYGFENIPKEILTEELCMKAIKQGDRYNGTILKHVPDSLKTQTMCDLAVEVSPWSLKDVPDEYVTYEMLRKVALAAPARLADNFPVRFHNDVTVSRLFEGVVNAEYYKNRIMKI